MEKTEKRTVKHDEIKFDEIVEENAKLKQELQIAHNHRDEAIAEVKEAKRQVNLQVMSRLQLINKISPYMQDTSKLVYLSERAIMETAMDHINNKRDDYSKYSDDMVKGMFHQFMKTQEMNRLEQELNNKFDKKLDKTASPNQTVQTLQNKPVSPRTIHEVISDCVEKDFWDQQLEHSKKQPWTSE